MSTSKDIINYTDMHDVDENRMTMFAHGGGWPYESMIGITQRDVSNVPNASQIGVASRRNITQHDS